MNRSHVLVAAVILTAAGAASVSAGEKAARVDSHARQRAIDTQRSVITVQVKKAGVFGALGHDHDIAAPIARGSVDAGAGHVDLRIDAGAMRVRDPEASAKDRAAIQSTMLGAEVLDVARYPEIVFRSTSVEPAGPHSWTLLGDLTLHGHTQAVGMNVREQNGHYLGSSSFKQSEFGIKPIRFAGGTVRVKDQIRIDFDIVLAR